MNKQKILIVDDEPALLDGIVNYYIESREPYELYQALNGETALRVVKEVLPDLVLTDWDMPVMDGLQLIAKMKASNDFCDIPVVMMTGFMLSAYDLRTAMSVGAVDYIRKPIDNIELLARTKSMLRISLANKTIRQQEEDRLNAELDYHKKELALAALHLANYQKRNEEMLVEIKRLIPYINKEGLEIVRKIISDNKSNYENDFLNIFETQFKDVHADFYERLDEKHPELTPTEKKICTFLKMNMNTKEIAVLLLSTPASIEVSRAKIRKKFGIDHHDSLTAYIAGI
ncbi:MAG: response regulator [Bacteroidales bacterium]|nr:response regulator [Bacteroidales bacterium]MDD3664547.1 response regulator [Bacteroidales bacterium]